MIKIKLAIPTKISKLVSIERVVSFSALNSIKRLNKALFVLLMVVFTCLPGGLTNASFYSESTIQGATFSTDCWVAPTAPTLVSLENDALIHQGNPWLSNPLMTWTASETTCPSGDLQYQFRVSKNNTFTDIVQTSDWLDVTEFVTNATASGEYYWDVTVRDSSHPTVPQVTSIYHHYTVDLSDLQGPSIVGWNQQSQSSLPGDVPTDLTCGATTTDGDDTHQISTVWTSVSGSTVRYQREVTKPNNTVLPLVFESNNFASFFSLGSFPDIIGLWKTRVRAFEDNNGNNTVDSGERVSAYTPYCELNVKEVEAPLPVVLNELLPDPQGPDNYVIPFGEWVEVYNRTDAPIDIKGWKITAGEAPLVVSSTNTFPDVAFGVGTTVLPAHGFLVVYRSGTTFDLKNIPDGLSDSETVQLFNSSDVLQDSTVYSHTRENKSITRIPDGADNWVDPIPSPGRPNTIDESQLDPWADIAQQDKNYAMVAILEAANYKTADMVIEYTRMQDGEEVMEALSKQVTLDQNIQFITDIFLGSVSSNVEYPHSGISKVKLHLILHSDHLPDRTIEVQFNGNWSEK